MNSMQFCRALLPEPILTALRARIDVTYRQLEHASPADRAMVAQRLGGLKFVSTASSLLLEAALSEAQLKDLFGVLRASEAAAWITARLGAPVAVDLDQAWIRRQYAPSRYPPLHRPHGWHQDGALGFDFLSRSGSSNGLLSMVTAWITLNECGSSAPGLELLTRPLPGLLAPAELTESAVSARFSSAGFSRPVMNPGDALLFEGSVLHRTYVNPAMTADRTSIELRFFPAEQLPERLAADRFCRVGLSPAR